MYFTTNSEGDLTPIFGGFFEHSIVLPFDGLDGNDNPVFCNVAAHYLKTTWLKKPAILSRASVTLLEKSPGMNMFVSKQHAEGG